MTLLATLDHADADLTACLARVMAAVMKPGDVIALQGPVGAGKTHFARALITARLAARGEVEDIPSPTFTLVQVYGADPEIWHADLYRLSHPDEAIELGLEDAFDEAICLIEWPERLGDLTPAKALTLRFEATQGGETRRVTLSGPPAWAARLSALKGTQDG